MDKKIYDASAMTPLQAIQEIRMSGCDEGIKNALCMVAGEWDYFMELKQKHAKEGLLRACYEGFGVKFIGMYGIGALEDLVMKAEANSLLA